MEEDHEESQERTVEKLKRRLSHEKVNTLEWCRLSLQLAKAQYELFCVIESINPEYAIQLLYDSAMQSYGPAWNRLFHDKKILLNENEDLERLNSRELFLLGLQAKA